MRRFRRGQRVFAKHGSRWLPGVVREVWGPEKWKAGTPKERMTHVEYWVEGERAWVGNDTVVWFPESKVRSVAQQEAAPAIEVLLT